MSGITPQDAQIARLGHYIVQLEEALGECGRQNEEKAKKLEMLTAASKKEEKAEKPAK